jgi:hypothetical protein
MRTPLILELAWAFFDSTELGRNRVSRMKHVNRFHERRGAEALRRLALAT